MERRSCGEGLEVPCFENSEEEGGIVRIQGRRKERTIIGKRDGNG